MPRKRRTPKEINEVALHAAASASTPPFSRPATEEPVQSAREEDPSGTRGPQGGGPPAGLGAQQDFGSGPRQGRPSGRQGSDMGRQGGDGRDWEQNGGRDGCQGGFSPPGVGSSIEGVQGRPPLEMFGELNISTPFKLTVAIEEPGIGPAKRIVTTRSSIARRSTRGPGRDSVQPLPPVKENVKKVMYYI